MITCLCDCFVTLADDGSGILTPNQSLVEISFYSSLFVGTGLSSEVFVFFFHLPVFNI